MNQTEFLNPKNDILCCWELGLTWIFNFCRTWAEIWIVKTFLNQKAFYVSLSQPNDDLW